MRLLRHCSHRFSSLLNEAGFCEWGALHVARWGQDYGGRFTLRILIEGCFFIFCQYGAALILTSVAIAMTATRFNSAPRSNIYCRHCRPAHGADQLCVH
uniref:ArsB/NhaD family transporter n=1 Tax=Pseudomonas syringae TaxID=317 RepID=UPI001F2B3E17|nr:ArsB/NhaD family transporter [Pseudomonas syringae]